MTKENLLEAAINAVKSKDKEGLLNALARSEETGELLDEVIKNISYEQLSWLVDTVPMEEEERNKLKEKIRNTANEALIALAERGGYERNVDIKVNGDVINMSMNCYNYIINNVDEETKRLLTKSINDGK